MVEAVHSAQLVFMMRPHMPWQLSLSRVRKLFPSFINLFRISRLLCLWHCLSLRHFFLNGRSISTRPSVSAVTLLEEEIASFQLVDINKPILHKFDESDRKVLDKTLCNCQLTVTLSLAMYYRH